jgi:hypothetical protein
MMARAMVGAALVLVYGVAAPASAQRRGENGATASALLVELKFATRFGDVTVVAQRYRVDIADGHLTLADPVTMVPVASLAAVETAAPDDSPSIAQVIERGDEVQLVVHSQDRIFTARGVRATAKSAAPAAHVDLAPKAESAIAASEAPTEGALVTQAVQRYIRGIAHCVDGAQKAHWMTDDPRFANCLCPVASKWRLPKVQSNMRVHQPLVAGKLGFSFTATPEGHLTACRVWAGAQAPELSEPLTPPANPNSPGPVKPSAAGATGKRAATDD